MKKISENLIKPMEDADILKGRINRKLIQNIFFIDIDRPSKMNGFTLICLKKWVKLLQNMKIITMLYAL